MVYGHKSAIRGGAVPYPEMSARETDHGQASDDDDPKLMMEKNQFRKNVQHVLLDKTTTANQKVETMTGYLTDQQKAKMKAEAQLDDAQLQNDRLKRESESLAESFDAACAELQNGEEKIKQLEEKIEAIKRSQQPVATGTVVTNDDESQRREELEQMLNDRLQERNAKIAQLEQSLVETNSRLKEYHAYLQKVTTDANRFAAAYDSRASGLAMDNMKLREQLERMVNLVTTLRAADIGRWNQMQHPANIGPDALLQQQQEWQRQQRQPARVSRLTYGTVDSSMSDASDPDTKMTTIPERYNPPVLTRMRRRLARVKPRARRAGSPVPRAARPAECRKGYAERRAASTYLQYRDGPGKDDIDVLKPLGRNNVGAKQLPRKRTRLEKGVEMVRRMEAVSQVRKLPRIPRSLRPPRMVPNVYTKRDDAEMSKLMGSFSMSDPVVESTAVQTDSDIASAKLEITVQYADPFLLRSHPIPRRNHNSTPYYLNRKPKPLSGNERDKRVTRASDWNLGPDPKERCRKEDKKGKPQQVVRYTAEPTVIPDGDKPIGYDWPLESGDKASEWSFNWSQVLIVILLLLLFFSNMARPEDPIVIWKEVNKNPQNIVAKLRTPVRSDSRTAPTIVDFEVARWSDIDPSILG
ncbi:uncharacterized protein APUU_80094A [Aspergillus puulaauensis]|uniref:Uncharacterized protein n=1 Tax=Aspergillus puulaauensis TaxID=1220207 RepID=A0A7R7XXY5_9EURO|nr:uncharacterized protein APUU_80094A [Aspergillus puulaauensis]BCS29791.1 hypothetical protein APUU_80094A [Aspergillus puulaauensis]